MNIVYDESNSKKWILWIAGPVIFIGTVIVTIVILNMCARSETVKVPQALIPTTTSTQQIPQIIEIITPEIVMTREITTTDILTGTITGDVWMLENPGSVNTLPAAMLRGYEVMILDESAARVLVRHETGNVILQGWVSKRWVALDSSE